MTPTLPRSALAAILLTLATAGMAAPPPIAHFFENASFSQARLSPDARSLALRVSRSDKRYQLAMMDLVTREITSVAGVANADIGRFEWVNSKRLVFNLTDSATGVGEHDQAPGLFAVNRDGSDLRPLVERTSREGVFEGGASAIKPKTLKYNNYLVMQKGKQDSDFVYLISPNFATSEAAEVTDLRRLNTVTGDVQTVARPANTVSWLLDHQGEPRIAVSWFKELMTVHYREPATGLWRALTSYNPYKSEGRDYDPLAFGPDGTLYVEAYGQGDTLALHTVDLATGKLSAEPVVRTKGYDFSGALITNAGKLLGLRVTTDAKATVWFDASMKKIQQAVDTELPATINLISVAARPETPWVLVDSYSDALPHTLMLFNTETGAFSKVGSSQPKIQAAQMGAQELVHYKARDGREIPAWLTLPPGANKKNLPLVVLVHGGPFMRGNEWEWDADRQFLATRGYAVLEPEFRGSTGFGYAHFKAGWKQWGLTMQDDIADGTRWAIAQGYAHPRRVCIAGASYGGYAALMGLVNDPDLYKCAINWVGVTDLNLMYNGHWSFESDMEERYVKYGMPELVGDQVKDAAQLRATSPLKQAARITQPLLMAYGGSDRRVPSLHGERFRDAVRKHNPNVEYIAYPAEGHGWHLPETRIDFWTRVEKFLDQHIGKP